MPGICFFSCLLKIVFSSSIADLLKLSPDFRSSSLISAIMEPRERASRVITALSGQSIISVISEMFSLLK